jgi:L-aminopeptidase/D-esterase-like protein
VPAAVLFDLGVVDRAARPDAESGRLATVAAEAAPALEEGAVGAGTGATVGKLFGAEDAAPGGLGTAGLRLPDGSSVWALATVNAVGDVVDEQGDLLAGVDTVGRMLQGERPAPPPVGTSTTLVVVGTDLALSKTHAHRLATVAHDGLAHAIRPVHTSFDGDTVFAFATGQHHTEMDAWTTLALEVAAVDVVARAVRRAVRLSR